MPAQTVRVPVELKLCPFCGGPAMYWRDTHIACCADEECVGHDCGEGAKKWNRRAAPRAPEGDDGFRDALIDALVVNHIYRKEHDSNPRLAVADLVAWEQQLALDPAVSSDAQKLRAAALEEAARVCDSLIGTSVDDHGIPYWAGPEDCAAAVRALAPQAADGWIAVGERLPEKVGEILVVAKVGGFHGVTAVYFDPNACGCFGLFNPGEVTHWMHLPEPPK